MDINKKKQLNNSTTQQLNNSTTQQINKSTNQQLNKSTTQQLNNSTTQQLNKSTNQQINFLPVSFKTLSSEYINKHSYFTARKDSYQTPSGRVVDPYFVVELPTSVVAMAITEDKKVILIRQYRYPVNDMMIELPGGFIDHAEQPQQAIQRELLEETGYSFTSIHYLGITAANPGVLNNFTHMFLALGGKKTAEQLLDNNEEIELQLIPLEQVKLMLQHQEIRQSMHALCLFYGFSYIEKNELLEV